MILREYQQRTIDMLYDWFRASNEGNPCLVLPTGSGKSHIIAALCKDALQNWPETRILMLTHVRELIRQNSEKMLLHWPDAPMGIYSAGLGRRELGEPITFAGIQSVRNRAAEIGHVDIVIIDECFTGETMISTTRGEKRIDEVRCGDLVYNQCGVGEVKAISTKMSSDIYQVRLSNGQAINCTGKHQFFTTSGWREASSMAVGQSLFCIQDMQKLWESVQTMDEASRGRSGEVCDAGGALEEAKLLLGEVCKEIQPDSAECRSTKTNAGNFEKNQASTYSTWRKRAISSFATVGASSCVGRRMDSGIYHQDQSGTSQRCLSKRLQGGHCQPGDDACDRTRWRESLHAGEKSPGQEEGGFFGSVRVESITHTKRRSPTPVFNLQISRHPSYFAGGIAVHNCHLVGHKDEGGYRKLVGDLTAINPALRIIGLTASPYRLGHGLITDKPAIFDALIEPVSIEELIYKGYLSTLRSKATDTKIDTTGVHKRGGEYIESELQAAVDTAELNASIVQEIIARAGDRKAWLIFCAGVDHAQNVASELRRHGVTADCVLGETPKAERDSILSEYMAGNIRALTNANVLTTGFDYPDIDLIAMLRPTMSPVLYLQSAGRGMRVKSHADHCLVLDFAGNVSRHGPITAIQPPKKAGETPGDAPVKTCEQCGEICHAAIRICPACGAPFPIKENPALALHDDDIIGIHGTTLAVESWQWRRHVSRTSGIEMLAVTYYGCLSDPPITEYLPVLHPGRAGEKARRELVKIAALASADESDEYMQDLAVTADKLTAANPPASIEYKRDGKFHRVINRKWR